MPVTVKLAPHPANNWAGQAASSAEDLYQKSCPQQHALTGEIIKTSLDLTEKSQDRNISHSSNGFVDAARAAYNQHHHLSIRPDDVWLVIVNQISFFVNGHAEELRHFLVAHEGQKHLEVKGGMLDFAAMAQDMTHLIAANVKDPELRHWIMPSFSTTTDTDRVVGAILFMGALKKYFSYGFCAVCGIPSVTLLGEVEDWQEMLRRVDKIDAGMLGPKAKPFAAMLQPILQHMIMTFEASAHRDAVDHFWGTIATEHYMDSGIPYLTGWLTAFCYWDEQGNPKRLSDTSLFGGAAPFPRVDTVAIPQGFSSVNVHVNDYGNEYDATMIAGSVGIAATASSSASSALDSIQPVSGWWVCLQDKEKLLEEKRVEKKQLLADLSCFPEGEKRCENERHKILERLGKYEDVEVSLDDRGYEYDMDP
ncbi:hypothetical protein PG999_010941 [Apiospora kogelbergensis]|uniref:DUF4419 domain-containing protein n=1 Tax=Apiospora kogelbergensis TaxID=1337665 RepID=A0AAW0QDH2_9PEZI